jgi:hypothetical protein
VDATLSNPVFHPTHNYSYVACGVEEVFSGIDAVQNVRLSDINHSLPLMSDAQWKIRHGQLIESRARGDVLRVLELHWCWPQLKKRHIDCYTRLIDSIAQMKRVFQAKISMY